MVIVLMGAAGAGKTTVGRQLADRLIWLFCDADLLHSPTNREKMSNGVPLTDDDRRAWLDDIREMIARWVRQKTNVVLACSLLKQSYRALVLAGVQEHVKLVYLRAGRDLLEERLTHRIDHFAGVGLLDSQLEVLEEPSDALILDASNNPEELIQQIRLAFSL